VRKGERIVVGVNEYRTTDDEPLPILRIDPALERKQARRLGGTRDRRDAASVEAALSELKRAASADENLMPNIVEAARARASEGEMIAALQEVFGTYTETPIF
jgi:methylmalonyl-CoA mutase N-terminal domain/subunit